MLKFATYSCDYRSRCKINELPTLFTTMHRSLILVIIKYPTPPSPPPFNSNPNKERKRALRMQKDVRIKLKLDNGIFGNDEDENLYLPPHIAGYFPLSLIGAKRQRNGLIIIVAASSSSSAILLLMGLAQQIS